MNKTKTRKKRHIQALTWLLLTLLLVAGCRESSTTVSIVEPRARLTPGVASTGAVYMKIVNRTYQDDRLASVESSVAKNTETHETVHRNGVARMLDRHDGFAVPARSTVELKPGGKHIMLVGLQEGVKKQHSIGLKLRFEKAGMREIRVPVVEKYEASCCQKK